MALVADEPERYAGVAAASRRQPSPPRRDGRNRSANSANTRAFRSSSTTSPARPSGDACASAANGPTRPSAPSFIRKSAKAAAIAGASPTAWRSSRWRPNSDASGASINRAATRISPASMASARASSPFMADAAQARGRGALEPLSAAGPRAGSARNRRALQRAGGRHRRLGRRHHQPDDRHRRLSRRALQLQSRSDRLEPEIWRGDRACAHRARARRSARDAHRRGRSGRADRLRPHRRRGRRIALQAQARQDERGDLRRSDADRRFRPQSRTGAWTPTR